MRNPPLAISCRAYHPTCLRTPSRTSAASSSAIPTAQPSSESALFCCCPALVSPGILFVLLIHRCFRPKQKAHSRLVSGLQQPLKLLRRKDHPPDVPKKTIEQHELFEHIIGIWLSAIIGKTNPNGLIGCLSSQVDSDYFFRDESFQFGTELPSATDMHLIPTTLSASHPTL
jgi:hypothetical protein